MQTHNEFFAAFELNTETYTVSRRIHSECRVIYARPTLNANTFHVVEIPLYCKFSDIIFMSLYCKFTVISWLNDCEDMKLVVQTHIVLFYSNT